MTDQNKDDLILFVQKDDIILAVQKFSMKMYDDFAPLREFLSQNPEMKEPIVSALGEILTKEMAAPDFYVNKPRT